MSFSHCSLYSCRLAELEGPPRPPIQFHPLVFTNEEVIGAWRRQVTRPSQDFDVAAAIAEISRKLNMSQWLVACLKRYHFSVADAAPFPLSLPGLFLCAAQTSVTESGLSRPLLQISQNGHWMSCQPLRPSLRHRVENYSWCSFANIYILHVKILRDSTYCSRSRSNYKQTSDSLMVKARGPGKATNAVQSCLA